MTSSAGDMTAAFEGRYSLERELGGGGMATVYLALDVKLRRRVALKVLRPELAASLSNERFLREKRQAREYYEQFLRRYDQPIPSQAHLVQEAKAALASLQDER